MFGRARFTHAFCPNLSEITVIEREAEAIVECCRCFGQLLHSVPCFQIISDQQFLSFFRDTPSSKTKVKIWRWRIELSEFRFQISYRPGPLNKVADALFRCAVAKDSESSEQIQVKLCHPGTSRLHHYIIARSLSYSLEDVKALVRACKVCQEIKQSFFKPAESRLVKSTRAWERLSIDFIGPRPSNTKKKYILSDIDEFARYPFAFP